LFLKAATQGGSGSFGNLPAMMAALVQAMQQASADLSEIRSALTVVTPSQPDAYGHWARIDQTNGWQTAEQGILVGLLVSADTSDFYGLNYGNDPQYLVFGLTSYVFNWIDLSGTKRIPFTRGMTMKVGQLTSGGSAVIHAYGCYIPGDDWGQKVK
jgi:hypothetical protein